jgi:hypothetical protein
LLGHEVASKAESKAEEEQRSIAARWQYEFERVRDPKTGLLPNDIFTREQAFVQTLPVRELPDAHKHRSASAQQEPFVPPHQSLLWKPIGPGNVGGRTRALAVDVANENILLAGAVSGGMWRSLDGGASWVQVSAPSERVNVTCLAQDTRRGKRTVWYAGTGELLSTTERRTSTLLRTMNPGSGIYKSLDNGASWQPLGSTRTQARRGEVNTLTNEMFQGVWSIVTDASRNDSDVVYAACYGGIVRSNNGGATWTHVLGDAANKAFCSDVVVTPNGVLYAALGTAENGTVHQTQGLWRSTDGLRWVNISPQSTPSAPFPFSNRQTIRRIKLALAPSNPNVVYVVYESPTMWAQRYVAFASSTALWKYTYRTGSGAGDGGVWEQRSANIARMPYINTRFFTGFSTLAGYCLTLAVKPNDENVVFLGGTDLYRSNDGFATATATTHLGGYPYTQAPEDLHPDIHNVVFLPSNPDVMLVASDGGVCKAQDNRVMQFPRWQQLNNGYFSTQAYYLALDHHATDDFVVAGFQDNSSFFTNSADPKNPWIWARGGDGQACAITKGKNPVIASSQYGSLYAVKPTVPQPEFNFFFAAPFSLNGQPVRSAFCTFFALEPNDTRMLYVPMWDRLLRYNNLQAMPQDSASAVNDTNWVELAAVSREAQQFPFTALAVSKNPAHRLYLGTFDGRMLRVDNANGVASSVRLTRSVRLPVQGFIASIAVDETNADNVLVALSNYNTQSLFASNDGGATWQAVSGNLEERADGTGAGPSVRCVKILRFQSKVLYLAGTSSGLFSTVTLDGMNTRWQREGATTLGNLTIEHLDARSTDGRIVLGTHGGGIFAGTLGVESPQETLPQRLVLEQTFPNPASNQTTLRFTLPDRPAGRTAVSLKLYNVLGQEVATLLDDEREAGQHTLVVNFTAAPLASLASGAYFYRLQTPTSAGTEAATGKLLLVR